MACTFAFTPPALSPLSKSSLGFSSNLPSLQDSLKADLRTIAPQAAHQQAGQNYKRILSSARKNPCAVRQARCTAVLPAQLAHRCSESERFTSRASLTSDAMAEGDSKLPEGLHQIGNDEELDEILAKADEKGGHVVIDWMAQWCRKCIYLKPKIEKLASDYPDMHFCVVDVNAVPSSLVKRAKVASMPTIQLWKNKQWQAEVVGGHKPALVLEEVRDMLNQARST